MDIYQFKKKDWALSAASLSGVELLMGSNQAACKTIPMLPSCSFWMFIDLVSKQTMSFESVFYFDI